VLVGDRGMITTVVVKGPQHRFDGAVQVRGDLRGAPLPVLVRFPHQHGSSRCRSAGLVRGLTAKQVFGFQRIDAAVRE